MQYTIIKKAWAISLFMLLASAVTFSTTVFSKTSNELMLSSPDNRNKLTVKVKNGKAFFSVKRDKQALLLDSELGLEIAPKPLKAIALEAFTKSSYDSTRAQLWGQQAQVRNQYNAATLALRETQGKHPRRLEVDFRVYNDGIALRYSLPAQSYIYAKEITAEKTILSFAEDLQVRSYKKEGSPTPAKPVSAVDHARLPMTLQAGNGLRLAIHEAAAFEGASLEAFGEKSVTNGLRLSATKSGLQLPYSTAWRVLMISEKPGDLLLSNMLTNLSPDSKIADTSWIKPGKALWDWRVRGERYGDFEYKIDEPSLRRFIDFAADNNVQYVMIDANWYGPEHKPTSNPFTPKEGLSIKTLIDYGRSKDVGFILYMNDKASIHFDMDELFRTYSEWGAAGIKYGFIKAKGQLRVEKTLHLVELAAKHKLLINFHDNPIAPTGVRRTWPHWLTREFVHGQADAKRSFSPTGFIDMIDLNMLTGPLDMSNGFYKLADVDKNRDYVFTPIYSTVAAETARVLITFSGLIILPDAPEEYMKKSDLFDFIRQMPATWDESKVLASEPGRLISMARRSADNWFVGSVYNEQGGDLEIALDFLAPGAKYVATLYEDTKDTHFKTNPEAYQIKKVTVKKGDTIKAKIAPGGGHAIWLRKVN